MASVHDTNQEATMTDTFELADVGISNNRMDRDHYYLKIREIYSDGTSKDHVVDDPYTLYGFLVELKASQDRDILATMTEDQRARYDRFSTEPVWRYDGSCSLVSWCSGRYERDEWLAGVSTVRVDIEWVWMLGDGVPGPTGSAHVSESNTFINKEPRLAGDIWSQVDWY